MAPAIQLASSSSSVATSTSTSQQEMINFETPPLGGPRKSTHRLVVAPPSGRVIYAHCGRSYRLACGFAFAFGFGGEQSLYTFAYKCPIPMASWVHPDWVSRFRN